MASPADIIGVLFLPFPSASLFVRFMDCIGELQRRVQPHVLEYRRNIEEETKMNVSTCDNPLPSA